MSSNTKPWGGGIGAWALEAEQAEAEERAAAEAAAIAGEPTQSFPSLKEAVSAKPKKKKGTKLTLSEFTTGTHVGPGGGGRSQKESIFEPKGLTPDDLLRLPTGPRERTAEELESGRGFRGYGSYGGGGGGGGFRGGRDDGEGRRSYGGGFDEESRRAPRGSDFEQMPSRADEVDNWGAAKKAFGSSQMEPGRRDRYDSLGGGGGTMRADEVDNWSMGKKQLPPARTSGFGSGFRDSSGSSDSDRWARGTGMVPSYNGERERPRLVLDPPKKDPAVAPSEPGKTRPSPFGVARPREEVLAEKGVDWRKVDSEIETKKPSRPTSSHSSRPSSAQSSRGESAVVAPQILAAELGVKPRPKVNPFGDAKPREVVLEEKGMDWKKIDLELEHLSVDRPETEQEILLKEEISHLKKTLNEATDGNVDGQSTAYSTQQLATLHEQIIAREKDLEQLIHELDDKVKFGQKAASGTRPGSGVGRVDAFSERPPSQSSVHDESRSMDFMDRPGSRGSVGDMRSRPQDERRGFRTGRDGGFFGDRGMNRSRSRERW